MSTLLFTLRESIRYHGRSGHWSWLAHRVSGLAILSFLVIHVWDTANAFFYPQLYGWSIAVFKHPVFAVGEIGVMAAVLYHAFNGIRITLLDFRPEWWEHQRTSALIVWAVFLVIFVPIGIYMFINIINHCTILADGGSSCWAIPPVGDFIQ